METKEIKEVKVLQNKTITLRPIVRGREFAPKDSKHDGRFMYTGCRERFHLAKNEDTGSFINVFEPGEIEAFEKLLNKKPGELSLYNRNSPFWAKMWVELDRTAKTFNLNDPIHALRFKILKSYPNKIAPNWESRENLPSYKWAIIDEDYIDIEDNKKADAMQKAMTLYFEIKKSKKKMSDVLRLLGKKLPESYDTEFLDKEIMKIISQVEKTTGVLSINDFISAASDPQISEKIFILNAIEAKAIISTGGEYRDADTNALLGRNMKTVVDHFSDPLYQEDKLLIEEKIKRAGK